MFFESFDEVIVLQDCGCVDQNNPIDELISVFYDRSIKDK